MNERIRELAEQAGFHNNGGKIFIRTTSEDITTCQRKFAELIVRECCDILTDNVEVALNASGSPVYPEGLIREHFGVEE